MANTLGTRYGKRLSELGFERKPDDSLENGQFRIYYKCKFGECWWLLHKRSGRESGYQSLRSVIGRLEQEIVRG